MALHFGPDDPPLLSYRTVLWPAGESHTVEFYPGELVHTTVISSLDPSLSDHLQALSDGGPISLDLEWVPDYFQSTNPIELIQLASSRGTLVITIDGSDAIVRQFLRTHRLFGKGTQTDRRRLGEAFDIEDIEVTRLAPNGLPINFTELTESFLGPSCAPFKAKSVSRSDWSRRPLTTRQVLYAAHDAHAIWRVYQRLAAEFPLVQASPVQSKQPRGRIRPPPTRGISFASISGLFELAAAAADSVGELFEDESIRARLARKLKPPDGDVEKCFFDNADDVLELIMPMKPGARVLPVRRIQFAIDLLLKGAVVRKATGRFICLVCSRCFGDFPALSLHCADVHGPDVGPDSPISLRQTCVKWLFATGSINAPVAPTFAVPYRREVPHPEEEEDVTLVPLAFDESLGPFCRTCNCALEDVERHCWLAHGEGFLSMFPRAKSAGEAAEKLGMFCVALGAAAAEKGGFVCGGCGAVTSAAGNMWLHIVYKHLVLMFVPRAEHDRWPLVVDALDEKCRARVERQVGDVEQAECDECGELFGDAAEARGHFIQRHLVCLVEFVR
jgi:hypothetical protein